MIRAGLAAAFRHDTGARAIWRWAGCGCAWSSASRAAGVPHRATGVFDQFSETKTGGAFTFMTGIGGFLQEFLYGYSGLRWESGDVRLAPSLTSQLSGVVLHNLSWRGRVFTVSVGRRTTTVTLTSGAPMPIRTRTGTQTLSAGHSLKLRTARPDLDRTRDAVRCQTARASSAAAGAPALAAVDGSSATDWQPAKLPASLTMATHPGRRTVSKVTVLWGREWPPAPKTPNVPPPPRPVKTLRASRYALQVSDDGRRWQTVASVHGVTRRTTDVLRFRQVQARLVRLRITKANNKTLPLLQEVTATG